jgi:hypothetical protein
VTLQTPNLSGTFSCFEDKINELTTLANSVNEYNKASAACSYVVFGLGLHGCNSDCSTHSQLCITNCSISGNSEECGNKCLEEQQSCYQKCESEHNQEKCRETTNQLEELKKRLNQLKSEYCP